MNTNRNHAEVVIIGAGMSGLMAARTLHESGISVLLLDKADRVGGRMGTRRIGNGLADHGAQFFTAKDPAFEQMLAAWMADDLVFLWSRGWSSGSLQKPGDQGYPRYAVYGGMSALPKRLALPFERSIRLDNQVDWVKHEVGTWSIHEMAGNVYTGRYLLMTAPVPQSLALLDAGGVLLDHDDRDALDSIEYAPCLTGLYEVDGAVQLPAPGAVQRRDSPISWIANNQQKGISETTVITVQADGQYSLQLWDEPDERILNALRTDLKVYLPAGTQIKEEQLKRWRYSAPTSVYPGRYMRAENHETLYFAGDAFGGPRVEGAVLSGLAVGEIIKTAIQGR